MSSSRSNYKAQRKDLRDTFDPHLAVDPEDRPYLTMDMTEEGDDFPRELRRNARNRPATTRYYERDIGEALDPHLAVDPEDRPYLLDEYEDDDREISRRGRGSLNMSKATRDVGKALDPHLAVDPEDRPYLLDKYKDDSRRSNKSKNNDKSYRSSRNDKDYKRRDIRSLPNSKTDIVCIDGSAGADRAMLYAARNLPKDHTLLLVHGVHSWMGSRISESDKPDILELEDHYESLCKKAGRDCKFKHFSYTTTSGFGDEVCGIADKKGVASVVIGRRENVSGMRRTLMGSSSQSVMNNCYVPVTIVGTAISNTKTKQY